MGGDTVSTGKGIQFNTCTEIERCVNYYLDSRIATLLAEGSAVYRR